MKGLQIMTWTELNKKYPEERHEMTKARERAFVKDLYDTYESDGFADKFWSPFYVSDIHRKYVGQPFTVIGRCEEGDAWDSEYLPSWKIKFEDGHEMYAYPEEINLHDMIANGYKPDAYKTNKESIIDYIQISKILTQEKSNIVEKINILTEEKANADRKLNAFKSAIKAIESVDEMERRMKLANDTLIATIDCQKNKMKIAEKDGDDSTYLQAYSMKSLCETIKDILDGNYDISE